MLSQTRKIFKSSMSYISYMSCPCATYFTYSRPDHDNLSDSIYFGDIDSVKAQIQTIEPTAKDLKYTKHNIAKFQERLDNKNIIHRYDFFFGGQTIILNAQVITCYTLFNCPYLIPVPICLMYYGIGIFTESLNDDWCKKYESIYDLLSSNIEKS